jgi:hypothetical protein
VTHLSQIKTGSWIVAIMPSPLLRPTSVLSSTTPGTFTVHPICLAWSTSRSTRQRCPHLEAGTEHSHPAAGCVVLLLYPGIEARPDAAETPYPKKVLHLPEILSQQEVARLIDATETPFQRILVMTLYAKGARPAEVAYLRA